MLEWLERRLRSQSTREFLLLEALLYTIVAILLALLAIAGLVQAAIQLGRTLGHANFANGTAVLDQILLILILVQLMQSVRISVRSQALSVEPFLVVGLIASVRRMLVITLQSSQMIYSSPGQQTQAAAAFHRSMVELALLGVLILVFVVCLRLLHQAQPSPNLLDRPPGS